MCRRFVCLFVAVAVLGLAGAEGYPFARKGERETALDRYVAKPDDHFKWELVKTEQEPGLTSYTLDMTSQQWRTEKELDRSIWKHWVTISVPDDVQYSSAMMFIDGGSNKDGGKPASSSGMMKQLARQTHSIAAAVLMVPNEPIVYSDAMGWSRTEDGVIAYTWDKFYRTGDEEWPARLPMTKAVVRAMDAVQAFCKSDAGGKHEVKDFVVAGGSKRGWTTWTTAIVDTRVRAIVPCVIDCLNVIKSFHHHYEALGFWSAAIGDYQSLGILNWLDTPENAALMQIVDPINYKDRLTMPKLIITAGNDQFFVPDSSQFYWDELQGPKWIRTMPNVGHGLEEHEAYRNLASFYHANIAGLPTPNYEFSVDKDGVITVKLLPAADGEVKQPSAVKLWAANNPKARDFRGDRAKYIDTALQPVEKDTYRAKPETPKEGFTSYFIELTFPGPVAETPFTFTSGVRVTPDVLPGKWAPPATPPQGFITKQAAAK